MRAVRPPLLLTVCGTGHPLSRVPRADHEQAQAVLDNSPLGVHVLVDGCVGSCEAGQDLVQMMVHGRRQTGMACFVFRRHRRRR